MFTPNGTRIPYMKDLWLHLQNDSTLVTYNNKKVDSFIQAMDEWRGLDVNTQKTPYIALVPSRNTLKTEQGCGCTQVIANVSIIVVVRNVRDTRNNFTWTTTKMNQEIIDGAYPEAADLECKLWRSIENFNKNIENGLIFNGYTEFLRVDLPLTQNGDNGNVAMATVYETTFTI